MIAILASSAGALLAWKPTVGDLPSPPMNSVIRELPEWDAPPALPYVWSPEHLNWVVPANPTRTLTRLEFRWRYTAQEQAAIRRAIRSHVDEDVRDMLGVLADSLSEATEIDVTDPRTIAGVQYHAAVGLIAPTRVAEILAAP